MTKPNDVVTKDPLMVLPDDSMLVRHEKHELAQAMLGVTEMMQDLATALRLAEKLEIENEQLKDRIVQLEKNKVDYDELKKLRKQVAQMGKAKMNEELTRYYKGTPIPYDDAGMKI